MSFRLFFVFFLLFTVFTVEAQAWYILASRFLVNRLTVSSTPRLVGTLNLPAGTRYVKTFINRYGKWILLTIGVWEMMRILESQGFCVQGSVDVRLTCGTDSTGNIVCQSGGHNSERLFEVIQISGSCYGSWYVPYVKAVNPLLGYEALIPASGQYRFTCGSDVRVFEVRHNIGPCGSSDSVLDQRKDLRVRVFPNPYDFFRDEVVNSSPELRTLKQMRDQVLSDSSIPFIPEPSLTNVFPDLSNIDIVVRGDDLEIRDDVPEGAIERDIPRDTPRDTPRDEDISVPGLDSSVEIPHKRSLDDSIIQNILNAHPVLRTLSSISISASSGSCVVGSHPFVFDFCPYAWVFSLMGAVIVFIASVLPFVSIKD